MTIQNPIDVETPTIPIGFLIELSETTDQQDVLVAYARWVSKIIETDRATVALACDSDPSVLRVMAIEGREANATDNLISIEGSVIGQTYRHRRSDICLDLAGHGGPAEARLARVGLTACITSPIAIGDRCWGSIAVSFADPAAATEQRLLVLETMARCLASYILLHEQLCKVSELAITDPLTKAYNRRYFQDYASELWKTWKENGEAFSIVTTDLDGFKKINDTYGHGFGDDVLRLVASKLRDETRIGDQLVRMGGEEFCIVLPETDDVAASALAERMRAAIEAVSFQHGDLCVRITASFGVVTSGAQHDSLHAMMIATDEALYAAKRKGRNRVERSVD